MCWLAWAAAIKVVLVHRGLADRTCRVSWAYVRRLTTLAKL